VSFTVDGMYQCESGIRHMWRVLPVKHHYRERHRQR